MCPTALNDLLSTLLVCIAGIVVSTWYFDRITRSLKPPNMNHRIFCWIISLIQWTLVIVAGIGFGKEWFGIFQAIGLMLFIEYGPLWHFSAKDRQIDFYPLAGGDFWSLKGRTANTAAWTISFLGLAFFLTFFARVY